MFNTWKEIYEEIYRKAKGAGADDLADAKRLGNAGYQRLVHDRDYPFLRREGTFSTVAGTRTYFPEPNALRVLSMRIPSQDRYLVKVGKERLERQRPDFETDTATDCPKFWYYEEWKGAFGQPSSAGKLKVKSSSALDTASVTVTIGGEDADGEAIEEEKTLNGTTAVETTASFKRINQVSKSGTTAGRVTVAASAADTVVLSAIGPLQCSRRYLQVGLERTPDAVYTVYFKWIPWVPDLVKDSAVPLTPSKDNQLIVDAAMIYAAEGGGNWEQVASREKRFEEKLAGLRMMMAEESDTIHQWAFGTGKAGKRGYEPGDYTAFLRDLYWPK